MGETEYRFGDKVFHDGDRVQLCDGDPVFNRYRGLVGTVVGTARIGSDVFLKVSYDKLDSRVLHSDPNTLTVIQDEFDATNLNSFIENQ